jgi:hypothetical protein
VSSLETPPEADQGRALAFWLAMLREDPRPPVVLLRTRDKDLVARASERSSQKGLVLGLMGLLFFLLLAWVGEMVLRHVIETRDRLRAFQYEDAIDDEPDADFDELIFATHRSRDNLMKTRGLLVAAVIFGTLILNVIAFVWLLAVIK